MSDVKVTRNTLWKHIKSGDIYHVARVGLNATNGCEGQVMVRYTSTKDDGFMEFYREINEFKQKFVPFRAIHHQEKGTGVQSV